MRQGDETWPLIPSSRPASAIAISHVVRERKSAMTGVLLRERPQQLNCNSHWQ